MAIKPKDIYRGRKKAHTAAKIIALVLTLLLVLSVWAFFGLRKYCVYDERGNATLILPFSREAKETPPDEAGADPGVQPEEGGGEEPQQSEEGPVT